MSTRSGRMDPSSPPDLSRARRPIVSEDDYRENRAYLTLVLNAFLSDYLLRLYREFEGDYIQALVLANIAHHNVEPLSKRLDGDAEAVQRMLDSLEAEPGWMQPCNAFSISEALKIPRETVRRKVAALVRKGWLRRNGKKELFVTRLPGEAFFGFNLEMINDLLRTADRLRVRLADARAQDGRPGETSG
jgi:hypothetical protein